METRSSRSHFPHDEWRRVELAGATTNSDDRRGYRRRYDGRLEQTVAVGSYTTQRRRIAQTATMDVIDPPRGLRLPQKAQQIREPLQFRLTSGARGAVSRQRSCPRGQQGGRLPQEGGRGVVYSMLLTFVDSSPTTTCKGIMDFRVSHYWQAVSSLAKKVAVHP